MQKFIVSLALSLSFSLAAMAGGPTQVVYLEDAKAAAAARLELIDNATTEIKISTHIFSEDLVGNRLLAALVRARKRGVKVQILFDSWESSKNLSKPMVEALESHGVEVYKFRPLSPKWMLNFNRRLHDKLFLVDGTKMIQGDRNTTQNYFSLITKEPNSKVAQLFGGEASKTHAAFVSKEFYYEGAVAKEASEYYDDLIKNAAVSRQTYKGKVTPEIAAKLQTLDRHMKKNLNNVLEHSKNWKRNIELVENVSFFHDEVLTKGAKHGSFEPILDMINKAQKRIIIENPYIVMTNEMKEAFKAASARGVKITIITNSPMANDMALVGAAWESDRKFLQSIGATIYEHPGTTPRSDFSKFDMKKRMKLHVEAAIHNKAIIADEEVAMGSFNMDIRSRKHNLEVMVRIKSKRFMNEVKDMMLSDIIDRGYIQTVKNGQTMNVVPGRCKSTKVLAYMLKYFL